MSWLMWLESTWLARQVQFGIWLYPTLLCAHAIGMAMVVGVVLMLCSRVLGFPRGMPVTGLAPLRRVVWLGFGINALSGALLFLPEATRLAVLWTFLTKLSLILIGSIVAILLWRMVRQWPEAQQRFPTRARILAALAVILWLGVITAGRYIAYTLPET